MPYAQNRWSLLFVFQAMDAAGKDSTIKHVMSGVNPQGCQVVSFKQPTSEDLDHGFVAIYEAPPRAGADRHLQPVVTTKRFSLCACTRRS
jgi:polyphosphate kinase 2 (PPK2 family)